MPPSAEAYGQEPFSGVESRFIGHEDHEIVARYGQPTTRHNDHYGNLPLIHRRTYPEAFTYVYAKPSGSLYLSFCHQRGRWVCFSATWLPAGSAF